MAQLTQLNRDLTKLIDYIGGFVNWWMGMVTKLEALQKVVPQIRLDRSNPIRSDDVRRRWGEVQGQYDAYSRHVSSFTVVYEFLKLINETRSKPSKTRTEPSRRISGSESAAHHPTRILNPTSQLRRSLNVVKTLHLPRVQKSGVG